MQDLRTLTRTKHAGSPSALPRWQDTVSPFTFEAIGRPAGGAGVADEAAFDALGNAYDASGGIACGDNLYATLREHLTKQADWLLRALATRNVFSFVWRSWTWVPMAQLSRHDLSWSNHMARVRSLFEPRASEWSIALWFATSNPLLDEARPVDVMLVDHAAVLAAARNDSKLI